MDESPTFMLAISHITAPAGAATATALPSTKSVLSNNERTIVLKICGFLYGGSSKTKDDGSLFATVTDNSFDVIRVIITHNTITLTKINATLIEFTNASVLPAKNIIIIAISVGKRPLQGIKLFVNTAINRS